MEETDPGSCPGPGPGFLSLRVVTNSNSVGPNRELMDLPNELINEILSNMDIETLFQMSRVNRLLNKIISMHWPSILSPILERDFTPVEPLFRVFDVCTSKALTALDPFCDGDVFIGDRLVASSSFSSGVNGRCDDGAAQGCSEDIKNWTTRLSLNDGLAVFKVCMAVKRWEREFARFRFAGHSEHSRTLRPHELERLRLGLYVWWRYARYFHAPFCFDDEFGGCGFEDQRRFWLRRPHVSPDIRCNFMRQYSTTQLHVISDVWNTIRSAVGRDVCPSIATVREWDYDMSRADASSIGWGDSVENDVILATMMKLSPEDVLHLLISRHQYATKASLVQFIRLKNPSIEQSIETFSEAIMLTINERELAIVSEGDPDALEPGVYFPQPSGFPCRWGGVVDYRDAVLEKLREVYDNDAGKGIHYCIGEELPDLPSVIYVKAAVHPGLLDASV
ncbi:hypothetical protein QBC37DRAFT_280095 [Rhypophila decipiens]|uniref:F-box domain-containing protein n=1 Tax=Rhypophila decipiens TaxID=261697 RepID=A0AAN6YHF6_9PEZI|nr:hypothetical protein QBC37DRAFT_280095 [Rhypophila decipiens]